MIVFLTLCYQIKGNSVLGTLFHMKFVPSEYRLIYGSTIAFLWVLEHNWYSEIFVWCATGILSEIELWSISRILFHSFGYLNSSNLLIGIELNMIAWNPCIPLLSFHSKSEYICERLLLASYWLVKAHVHFVVPRVLPIYAIYCSYCPFVLWCLWDYLDLCQKW